MKYVLTILTLLLTVISQGQTADNTNRFNEKNIYYQALTRYIDYVNGQDSLKLDTLYIEDDFRFTDSLLSYSGHTKFIKLKYDQVLQFVKAKKPLTLHRIYPLRFTNGQFSVSFVPFIVTKGKKKIAANYANPGSYRVVFKFENETFNFVRVEGYGI